MKEHIILGHDHNGDPVTWNPQPHLIITAPARTGGSTILTRIAEPFGDRAAYINVASAHAATPGNKVRIIGRNNLDGAIRLLENPDPPRILCVDGMEYWLRGPDEPIANPRNNPRIAVWNADMTRAAHKRAVFRDRLRWAAQHGTRLILLFRTPNADTLLGRWPYCVTPTRCERIEIRHTGTHTNRETDRETEKTDDEHPVPHRTPDRGNRPDV